MGVQRKGSSVSNKGNMTGKGHNYETEWFTEMELERIKRRLLEANVEIEVGVNSLRDEDENGTDNETNDDGNKEVNPATVGTDNNTTLNNDLGLLEQNPIGIK